MIIGKILFLQKLLTHVAPRTCPNIQHNYAVATHDTSATACSGKEGSIVMCVTS